MIVIASLHLCVYNTRRLNVWNINRDYISDYMLEGF